MAVEPTPLRSLGTLGSDGCVLLRDVNLDYLDGGEDAVLRLINEATDLRSTSDELMRHADTWAQTYHLHAARANVAQPRPAEIRPGSRDRRRVRGDHPLPSPSQCARWTLWNQSRFGRRRRAHPRPRQRRGVRRRDRRRGESMPFETDVIVVIGVLEYVGAGTDDRRPYLDLLRGIHDRLRRGRHARARNREPARSSKLPRRIAGGSLQPGVSTRSRGSPVGSPARTFSRRHLRELFLDAGLDPTFRIAFPDYKLTRAVFGHYSVRSLLHRIPQFPSPDWAAPRPQLADEQSLWRTLVDAGLGSRPATPSSSWRPRSLPALSSNHELWPADIAARFYSMGRRARLTAETIVRIEGARRALRA